MNIPEELYRTLRSSESFGSGEDFGFRIMATVSRELSHDERIALIKAEEIVTSAIHAENIRLDPESAVNREYEKAGLLKCFPHFFHAEPIPNGYCNRWCCTQRPWYRVLTRVGYFVIGWRKSVMNIDWTDTIIKASGEEIFPGAVFTVSRPGDITRYCHASSYVDATKRIAAVIERAGVAEGRVA